MKTNSLFRWLLIFLLFIIIIGIFSIHMISFDHNEHMYITSGVFFANNQKIYYDFAYLQTPYLPIIYGLIYRIFNIQAYYLLIGKIISFVFLILSGFILFLLSKRVLRDIETSLCFIMIFLLNPIIIKSASEVSNYIMPLALSLISFYIIYVAINNEKVKKFQILIAGFLFGLSIGLKLTYASLIFPLAFTCLFHEGIKIQKEKIEVLIYFLSGLVIGVLPIIFFLSDLELFIFNNLGYHNYNAYWREITEFDGPMTLPSKFTYAFNVLSQFYNAFILMVIIIGLGLSIKDYQINQNRYSNKVDWGKISFFFVVVAVIAAIFPTPSWIQYYSLPIAFSFVFIIFLYEMKSKDVFSVSKRILLIVTMIFILLRLPMFIRITPLIFQRENWVALKIHDNSINIKRELVNNEIYTGQKIATLSPLFAIEANLPLYSEFSTGPFLFRIGDLLSHEQQIRFIGTSESQLDKFLDEKPPSAIITGFAGDLDQSFVDYAVNNNYQLIEIDGFYGKLFLQLTD